MRTVPDWGSAPLDRRKFDRNQVELPRYADIERSFSGQAQRLVSAFGRGQIAERELKSAFAEALQDAETAAFAAGRRAKGLRVDEVSPAEARMLAGRHSRNMSYFSRFVEDMKAGRGRLNYSRRADLYARSLWSLYTRAESAEWDDPAGVNARYHWIMDPEAEHCPDCLERARRSRDAGGFTWDEISELGWPGENTVCMVHCRCHVRMVKKRALLPERMDGLAPAKTPEAGLEELQRLLGGPELPVRLPAAGVPMVSLAPEVVDRAVSAAPEAARLLPLLPLALVSPQAVEQIGDVRLYTGYGLDAAIQQSAETGLWELFALALWTKPDDSMV